MRRTRLGADVTLRRSSSGVCGPATCFGEAKAKRGGMRGAACGLGRWGPNRRPSLHIDDLLVDAGACAGLGRGPLANGCATDL
jgi:hypothetical protein